MKIPVQHEVAALKAKTNFSGFTKKNLGNRNLQPIGRSHKPPSEMMLSHYPQIAAKANEVPYATAHTRFTKQTLPKLNTNLLKPQTHEEARP